MLGALDFLRIRIPDEGIGDYAEASRFDIFLPILTNL
ncbi:Uncharacterised protein [Chlamydia trachomatis]|nr:Uncharacterised protein [Chlamydia trachomatis]